MFILCVSFQFVSTLSQSVSEGRLTEDDKAKKLSALQASHRREEEAMVSAIEAEVTVEREVINKEVNKTMLEGMKKCGAEVLQEGVVKSGKNEAEIEQIKKTFQEAVEKAETVVMQSRRKQTAKIKVSVCFSDRYISVMFWYPVR